MLIYLRTKSDEIFARGEGDGCLFPLLLTNLWGYLATLL